MPDVKNAFNTVSWKVVMDALAGKGLPSSLRRVLLSYFSERSLEVGDRVFGVNTGVPQGSILEPTLWNLAYEGADTTSYADDLALIVKAKNVVTLKVTVEEALARMFTV